MYENFSIITFNAYAKKIFENDQERAKEYIQKDLIDVSDTTAPTTEVTTEVTTQDLDVEYVTTEGQIVDTRLYLSSPVEHADINDCYSMLLSIRNLFVVFMIIFVFFKVKTSIHNILAKIFEIGK